MNLLSNDNSVSYKERQTDRLALIVTKYPLSHLVHKMSLNLALTTDLVKEAREYSHTLVQFIHSLSHIHHPLSHICTPIHPSTVGVQKVAVLVDEPLEKNHTGQRC